MVSNEPDNNSTMVGDRKTCKQEQNSKMEAGLCEQVLLYDVHNDMHTDKFLNSLVSNRVSEYLNGNQDIQCDILSNGVYKAISTSGLFPCLTSLPPPMVNKVSILNVRFKDIGLSNQVGSLTS